MNEILTCASRFVDDKGRERIFQGMNLVNKSRTAPDWTEDDIRTLAEDGVNLLRLGCVWEGIEPEPGVYNTEYLDSVRTALDWCEKYGVYAFFDLHQDLYSSFGKQYAGDGAPVWTAYKPEKVKPTKVIWAEGYFFSSSVQRSFDNFWENRPCMGRGIQDWFNDMLAFTVRSLCDKPALMGWDVFNEPYPGTPGGRVFRRLVARVASLVLKSPRVDRKKAMQDLRNGDIMGVLGVMDDHVLYRQMVEAGKQEILEFDRKRYYPFLKRAAETIRSVTDRGVILMENCYYSNLGIPCSTPPITYDNGEREKKLAFAPHGYDITVDSPLTNKASPARVDFIFNEHRRTQERLNVPVVVGEWGGMVPGSTEYPALEHLLDFYDGYLWSQTYWHFNRQMHGGEIMAILRRPYPCAVAGRILSHKYDRKKREFVLHYVGDASIAAPTVVFLGDKPAGVTSTAPYTLSQNAAGAWELTAAPADSRCVIIVQM